MINKWIWALIGIILLGITCSLILKYNKFITDLLGI
jgi:hypothetical protein